MMAGWLASRQDGWLAAWMAGRLVVAMAGIDGFEHRTSISWL
jgi:hypothetical protein